MARLIRQADAKQFGLPGRSVIEMVSGEIGSALTFRIVEIPVPRVGETLRGPHFHDGYEECIYVLSGVGRTLSETGDFDLKPGDVVLMPANEKHVTRNVGEDPLVLLCFLPTPDISTSTQNFPEF